MKKVLIVFMLICCSLLLSSNVFADQLDADNVQIESRSLVMEVPIYAECDTDAHYTIFGYVTFNGSIVSTSGRIIFHGENARYIYVYYDQYGNYYQPYFDGYTFSYDTGYTPGCVF